MPRTEHNGVDFHYVVEYTLWRGMADPLTTPSPHVLPVGRSASKGVA